MVSDLTLNVHLAFAIFIGYPLMVYAITVAVEGTRLPSHAIRHGLTWFQHEFIPLTPITGVSSRSSI